jgi:hypothetical protein
MKKMTSRIIPSNPIPMLVILGQNNYLNEPNAKMLSLVLTNLKGIMNAQLEQQAILVRG